MTTHKEYGKKITYVDHVSVKGEQGFFIQFDGKIPGMLHMAHSKFIWISAEVAQDLGFIEDAKLIPGDFEKRFMGKKLWLIEKE